MIVTVRIQRFDPARDAAPYFKEYKVDALPTDPILSVLDKIRAEEDGSLTYRKSCAHGMCGSCAMMINGENKLACMTRVQDIDASRPVIVAPMAAPAIVKDLAVDMDPFFNAYKRVKPYLINSEPAPEHRERLQSEAEQHRIDESTKCILCGACTYSCPSSWGDAEYLGPAAMLKAYRFIFDSRDTAGAERLKVLDSRKGLWKCYTVFNCVMACPKEINITWHLSELKKRLAADQY